MQLKYYNVYVGDEPGDQSRTGPYSSLQEALTKVDKYHASGNTSGYRDMVSFNRQISSVFIIWNCSDTPEYFGEIMTRLKEKD